MPRIICCLDQSLIGGEGLSFFEFSTVVEGAVSDLMSEEEFNEYYLTRYGEESFLSDGTQGFKARLARAKEKGASCLIGGFMTLEEYLEGETLNVYGKYDSGTGEYENGWPGLKKFVEESWIS